MPLGVTCRQLSTLLAGNLPSDLPGNPGYWKINPADQPILMLSMSSDVYDRPHMYDIADSILAQKIAQIEGVGQVHMWGSSRPAVTGPGEPDCA